MIFLGVQNNAEISHVIDVIQTWKMSAHYPLKYAPLLSDRSSTFAIPWLEKQQQLNFRQATSHDLVFNHCQVTLSMNINLC